MINKQLCSGVILQLLLLSFPGAEQLQFNSKDDITHFTYNREYEDAASRLVYLRSRDYDPATRHFISRDHRLLWNRYRFADADPVNKTDPNGENAAGEVMGYIAFGVIFLETTPFIFLSGVSFATRLTSAAFSAMSVSGIAAIAVGNHSNNQNLAQPLLLTSYALGIIGLSLGTISICCGPADGNAAEQVAEPQQEFNGGSYYWQGQDDTRSTAAISHI